MKKNSVREYDHLMDRLSAGTISEKEEKRLDKLIARTKRLAGALGGYNYLTNPAGKYLPPGSDRMRMQVKENSSRKLVTDELGRRRIISKWVSTWRYLDEIRMNDGSKPDLMPTGMRKSLLAVGTSQKTADRLKQFLPRLDEDLPHDYNSLRPAVK